MRAILAALWTVGAVALAATPGDASCIGPQPVREMAERADAVVYARVVALEGPPGGPPSRFAIVQVERVLKGSAYATIGVALGPGAESGPGPAAPVATSVDYAVQRGEDHTLYLKQHAPGGYATDACAGSHPGAPTAEEAAFFGPGRAPDAVPGGVAGASDADRAVAAAATLIALVSGIAAIAFARRSARRPAAG